MMKKEKEVTKTELGRKNFSLKSQNFENETDNLGRKYVKIIDINVLSTSKTDLLTEIADFLSHNQKFSLLTVNPEIILLGFDNRHYANILNSATFLVPDGVGLRLAAWFLGLGSLNILPGRKIFLDLVALAARNRWPIFLLGGRKDAASVAAEKLKKIYPKLKVEVASGPKLNQIGEPQSESDILIQNEIINRINEFKPKILFVAFGAPKQEIWLYRNLAGLNTVGGMTVGGTFDYLAGYLKLPPTLMEKMHLEWLWRLLNEPKRIKRIIRAIIIFPWRIFWSKWR